MSINGEMVEMKYSDLECSQALLFNARSKEHTTIFWKKKGG